MAISALIVDDDSFARRVIRNVLEEIPGVEVLGEAGNAQEAGRIARELRPQVVFIDIDLPGQSGIELAREISTANPWTYLIFATAYNNYRDDAFDVYAFDYIVKPFKILRIRQTMERIRLLFSGKVDGVQAPSYMSNGRRIHKKLTFKDGERYIFLQSSEIIFATREERHSVIYLTEQRVVRLNKRLSDLEEDLGGYPFYRCHKGFIINLEMARELIPAGTKTFEAVMSYTDKRALVTWDRARHIIDGTVCERQK